MTPIVECEADERRRWGCVYRRAGSTHTHTHRVDCIRRSACLGRRFSFSSVFCFSFLSISWKKQKKNHWAARRAVFFIIGHYGHHHHHHYYYDDEAGVWSKRVSRRRSVRQRYGMGLFPFWCRSSSSPRAAAPSSLFFKKFFLFNFVLLLLLLKRFIACTYRCVASCG